MNLMYSGQVIILVLYNRSEAEHGLYKLGQRINVNNNFVNDDNNIIVAMKLIKLS